MSILTMHHGLLAGTSARQKRQDWDVDEGIVNSSLHPNYPFDSAIVKNSVTGGKPLHVYSGDVGSVRNGITGGRVL